MDRLNWLQFRLHPKARELKTAMVDYMLSLDQLHRQSAFSSGALKLHLVKRDKVLSEAHLLGTDRKTLEEMIALRAAGGKRQGGTRPPGAFP